MASDMDMATLSNAFNGINETIQYLINETITNDNSSQEGCSKARTPAVVLIYTKIIPFICIFGIVGNILNFVTLTHRSWKNISRLERFSHSGLIALAISDSMVCVTVLPYGLFVFECKGIDESEHLSFKLIYETFSYSFINIFMLYSTLLTVAVAVVRYASVLYPFRARAYIGRTFTNVILVSTFCLAAVCNIPKFFDFHITSISDGNGTEVYTIKNDPKEYKEYNTIYFCIAIVIPLIVLTFCNIGLLVHLKNQRKSGIALSRHQNGNGKQKHAYITNIILVAIAFEYMFFVIPSETVRFSEGMRGNTRHDRSYRILMATFNTLQVFNFASNFILYCVLNSRFRRTMTQQCPTPGQGYNSENRAKMRLQQKQNGNENVVV